MGKLLTVSVRESKRGGVGPEYRNKFILENPTLLLLFFDDMEVLFNAPIEKTCRMYLEKKSHKKDVFPF